ncbi:MAG: hypothetical protein ABSH35_36115 [Isosphaeraceae bacterium]|jgi:hypothetical protein
MHRVIADGEYDSMLVLFMPAVEQFADFFGESVVLPCQWATVRVVVERADFLRAYAPLFPGFSGVFMENITESYNVT